MTIESLPVDVQADWENHMNTISQLEGRKIENLTEAERNRLSDAVQGITLIAAGIGLAVVPGFHAAGATLAIKGAHDAGKAIQQQHLANQAAKAHREAQKALKMQPPAPAPLPPPPSIDDDMAFFGPHNPPPGCDFWIGCP